MVCGLFVCLLTSHILVSVLMRKRLFFVCVFPSGDISVVGVTDVGAWWTRLHSRVELYFTCYRFRCIVTEFCPEPLGKRQKIYAQKKKNLDLPHPARVMYSRFSLCARVTGNKQRQQVSWLFTAGTVSTSFSSSVKRPELNTPKVWRSMQLIYYPYKCNSTDITPRITSWYFILAYYTDTNSH